MNCKTVQPRLSAYLDRELSGDELLQVRAHLSRCPECRAEETELRRMKALLGAMETPEPPADLADRLCASVIRRAEEPRWTLRRSIATFSAVAAASMLLTFTFVTVRSRAEAAPQPAEQNLALDVQRDQAYDMGLDATQGASVVSLASYAHGR